MTTYFPKDTFEFMGIMDGDDKYKYRALIRNKEYDKLIAIPFGNVRSQHFKDTTNLNTYSHLDTNNFKLRQHFISKTICHLRSGYYSSLYFELKYLYGYEVDGLF